MGPLLLTPHSLQYLAQTILAGVLAGYLFARSRKPSATRDLAEFFACLTVGLLLLCLDSALVVRGAKVWMDAAPAVFQIAGVFLLAFAYRFPNASPSREARWMVRAAWLPVAADLVLAGPNLLRSGRGEPNPVLPFRVQLMLASLAVCWIVVVFLRRAVRAGATARRERTALLSFAGLVVVLLLVSVASYLANVGSMPRDLFMTVRTGGFLIFLFAFVVVHLNASPEPSELMTKLVGLSLVTTLLALAMAAALLPSRPEGLTEPLQSEGSNLFRAVQHRQAAPLALLMLGLSAGVLALYPLLLRAGLRRPLRALLDGVRRVNDGDLSVEVPVRTEDEIGYLARSFNGMMRSVREAVATRERAAALERELAIARRIQEQLLPETLPQVRGLVAAVRLLPAEAMSGDFYDAVAVGGGLTLLAVDVSGHGVPAALVAAMAKIAFSQASARADEPAVVLTAMNATLAGRIGAQFFTACCIHLDSERGLAKLGNAGHPPALLLRGGGVKELKPDGFLAGILPDAQYSSLEITLAPGDRLLLYTDGVTECSSPDGDDFGVQRLGALLQEGANLAPDAFADCLLERLRAWSGRGSGFEDDVTLLVVDRKD